VPTVERLGTEFVFDVGPAQHEAKVVTKSAKTSGAVARYGSVSVVTASASRRRS
jgi:hypothetical protein